MPRDKQPMQNARLIRHRLRARERAEPADDRPRMIVALGGAPLSLAELRAIYRGAAVSLDPACLPGVEQLMRSLLIA